MENLLDTLGHFDQPELDMVLEEVQRKNIHLALASERSVYREWEQKGAAFDPLAHRTIIEGMYRHYLRPDDNRVF